MSVDTSEDAWIGAFFAMSKPRTGFASVGVVAESSDGFEVDIPSFLDPNMRSLISHPQAYF
ncbi:hypothetical protein [Nostoc sp. DSM 114167]|uniref:hypothetical protein n=1 Tax=Nostoc sp. DSM 114167 TaxID=3439050 RepID=UPI0040466AC4